MKSIALSMLVILYMCGCNAQDTKTSESTSEHTQVLPKESWTVNKEVDEYGNITRYDSTYTWSYSNVEGDSVRVDVDSVMNSFHNYFNQNFPSMWGESFMNPMWKDSLFHKDFFTNDYFHRRWEDDFFDIDGMMHRMDSIHQRFFLNTYPGAIAPPEKKEGDEH